MMFTFDDPNVRQLAQKVHKLSLDLRMIEELKAPSIRDFAAAPLIDQWMIGHRLEPALTGMVSGHERLPDGNIVTSGIFYLDPVAGYGRTLTRWYRLGTPSS